MNDSLIIKYIIGKYCLKKWLLFLLLVVMGIDIYLYLSLTLCFVGVLFLITEILTFFLVKMNSTVLRFIVGLTTLAPILELTLPTLMICLLLLKL